jgi:carbon storage regulator
MLILSRKCNEQIVIGENIVITVVAIRGGNVRLGIDAPTNIAVHREEVHRAIQEGKIDAVTRAEKPDHSSESAKAD